MAVQAQFAGFAGCLPPYAAADCLADEQVRALLEAAAGNKAWRYTCAAGVVSGAQSDLTCNGGVALPSRKRGREDEFDQYVTSSSAALLPIPGMQRAFVEQLSPAPAAIASRVADSATASTSGRAAAASVADALAAELCRQGTEVDAVVRAECERLRAGLEQARKRQRQALLRAAAAGAARLLRAKEAELEAARRRAAELEERLRQAAAESQAWCGLARSNEAAAAGLRAVLDTLLLRGAGTGAAPAQPAEEEGFSDSAPGLAASAADDAESRCFVEAEDAGAGADTSSPPASRWACRGCGGGEASVLLLPCRHLCLCKACEPRADACPVCLAPKNAAIHVAAN
ncbi:putative BOI-related E3 ubiquitin-protein ligase 3 [Panicum miliaceum]|uniref:BOI-related E3 ubiquitin-protein ligase 3 n=1 Tax=Panicum miliaceum TaxID=4540 RepID=A0A3L6Q1H7_PANMI|nr:putative BOI-related E3 ubiquitin-protein ligase 3 [Panicum miliaceum]